MHDLLSFKATSATRFFLPLKSTTKSYQRYALGMSALEEDRIRVADLDVQIGDLEHRLRALRIEKALAQERIDSYKYPVLTLPNEIVSEIFIHFLPIYPLCPPLTGNLSPTLLTHICRKWREIALETPALWRAISLSYEAIPFARNVHIGYLWLTQSRYCPLSIDLDENYERGIDFTEVFANFALHRSRFEHLRLEFASSLPALEGPMPPAPRPISATLNDIAALTVTLPWAQLTSITFFYVYPSECFPILQQTSNLVHCCMNLCLDPGNDELEPDITLSRLESLILGTPPDSGMMRYLEALLVPALRSIKIPERFLGPNPIESLASFVAKSGCKLEQVHVTSVTSVPEPTYCGALLPTVQEFTFS
ncbi:F-box domain-containing protein [Mycena venus]|uniref:F-box domain-containing protein n=1 Tax=Mycena venus TaxID=2733690 RepID=A0A8H6Y8Q9_9AGAR|nr:F-box domain-containing protein [Mycena venus]